jgi:hypothetical protein
MKFLAGFAIGFIGAWFGVWYAAAHAEAPVPIEPNGYEEWRSTTYTLGPGPTITTGARN